MSPIIECIVAKLTCGNLIANNLGPPIFAAVQILVENEMVTHVGMKYQGSFPRRVLY